VKLNLINLTLTNALPAIYNGAGIVTVTNCTFSGNSGTAGGAIYKTGTLTVTNSTFSANLGANGGAILNNNPGMATVIGSTFFGNNATRGGSGGTSRIRSLAIAFWLGRRLGILLSVTVGIDFA
jgi:predicted outer membrane repeat protein